MKRVFFMRHSKSSWDDPELSDLDRPLNKRGKEDLELIQAVFKKNKFEPELLITSHAKRTRLTAEAIVDVIDLGKKHIHIDERIYHAFYLDIIEIIRDLSNKYDSVMLIGHNPTITNFANKLSKDYIKNVPTSGLLVVKSKAKKWEDFSPKNSALQEFIYPKQLR